MGTWKANIAKSKYQPGPPPKEATRVHEDRGNGFVLITTDTVPAQGSKAHGAYVYKPDGKQYPTAGLNQTNVQTISLVAVDPYTVTFLSIEPSGFFDVRDFIVPERCPGVRSSSPMSVKLSVIQTRLATIQGITDALCLFGCTEPPKAEQA